MADLVNASYALPFCNPNFFPDFWLKIRKAILPAGRFAGTFFGPHDDWSQRRRMTFHSRSELHKLFRGFEIEFFQETKVEGFTALGKAKRWHTFSIVAKSLRLH